MSLFLFVWCVNLGLMMAQARQAPFIHTAKQGFLQRLVVGDVIVFLLAHRLQHVFCLFFRLFFSGFSAVFFY